jgi:hypothetical protein
MRVGTITYATNTGLGILAKEFYDNKIINEVLIKTHSRLKTNYFWYPNSPSLPPSEDMILQNFPSKHDNEAIDNFLTRIDILLLFEIEWSKGLIEAANRAGVKTVLMPMYECTPYPLKADCYLTVSDLDDIYYKKMYPRGNVRRINVPSNSRVTWKERKTARVFIHNAGNTSIKDRNGTSALIKAIQYVKTKNIELRIRTQEDIYKIPKDSRVKLEYKDKKFSSLWEDGDVFLFPESWNGLSLPLQEAHASGLLVMAGNRFPVNRWLPREPLIPVSDYKKYKVYPRVELFAACYEPKEIAKKIDEFANTDITRFSEAGKIWAEKNSWEVLKPQYEKIFTELL